MSKFANLLNKLKERKQKPAGASSAFASSYIAQAAVSRVPKDPAKEAPVTEKIKNFMIFFAVAGVAVIGLICSIFYLQSAISGISEARSQVIDQQRQISELSDKLRDLKLSSDERFKKFSNVLVGMDEDFNIKISRVQKAADKELKQNAVQLGETQIDVNALKASFGRTSEQISQLNKDIAEMKQINQ